jgi:hypothetical protein
LTGKFNAKPIVVENLRSWEAEKLRGEEAKKRRRDRENASVPFSSLPVF